MAIYLSYKYGRVQLSPGMNIMGRVKEADIQIKDPFISRKHLSIDLIADNSLTLMDLGSSNGLYVKDARVPNAILRPGESFLVGKTEFTILEDSE